MPVTRALAYRARRFVTGVLVTGALVTAVLAMVSTSVPRAHAQSDSSASMTGAARDLFQEGVRAGREGRWEEARTAFELSNYSRMRVNKDKERVRGPKPKLKPTSFVVELTPLVAQAFNVRHLVNREISTQAAA